MMGIQINLSCKNLLLITILVVGALSVTCPAGQKDNGAGTCIDSAGPCATDFKDDGTGTCVPSGTACANGYHDDGSGDKCIGVNGTCASGFHDDGSNTKCIAVGQPCAAGYKDDGTGENCISVDAPCADNYKDNGEGKCIYSTVPCAVNFHDNGDGTDCISANGTCADNYIDDGTGQKCILNCTMEEKNNGQGLCIPLTDACAPGYTSDDPAKNDNCNACAQFFKNNGAGSCVPNSENCALGYKDDGTGLACVLLSDPCATGYISDGNGDNCFACDEGYRETGDGCGLTTAPCAVGFKDDGNGTCIDVYSPCIDGYKDDGTGNCVPDTNVCGANFLDDGNGQCVLALEQYVVIFVLRDPFGRFVRCDPTCSRCKLGGQCTVCKVGYSLDPTTKQCVFCDGCRSCNASNPVQCTGCFLPQVFNTTDKTCVDINCTVQNCLQCDIQSKCKFCEAGYALINEACQKCADENCRNCDGTTTFCSFDGCFEGYIFSQKVRKCLPCSTGCRRCKTTDVSECVGCNRGYYSSLISNKFRCIRCFSNCAVCSGPTTCIQCAQGFITSSDGTKCQVKCSDSCATCDPSNPDRCLTCYAGADLNLANQCVTDLACNNTNNCSACSKGYVIKDSRCYQCTYADTLNCVACTYTSLNTCSRCRTGFYLKNGACQPCVGNCASCVGNKACIRCSDGYYLVKQIDSASGKCKTCDPSCKTCAENPYVCTSCPASYDLEGSSCISIHKVTVRVRLGISIDQFIGYYDSLILWFIRKVLIFRPKYGFTRRSVILRGVTTGSIIIDTELSMDNADGVTDVATGLTDAMNSGTQQVDGLVIGGSAVSSEGTTTTSQESGSNLGTILGITIPVGIIILIAIIVIFVKLKSRKDTHDEVKEDSQRNYSGKHFQNQERFSEKV